MNRPLRFSILTLALAFALSASALADTMYTCSTESNGIPFEDTEYDLTTAQSGVISACESDSSANYAECQRNVKCRQVSDDGGSGGGYPGGGDYPGEGGDYGTWSCQDWSNGRSFTISGRGTYEDMLQRVTYACEAGPMSNYSECQQNAYCHQ